MTIKEARQIAHMTRQEVEDEFGIPSRSLQNWEAGFRDCPDYVEDWLIEHLLQHIRWCQIRWENEYRSVPDAEPKEGYSCWLCNQEEPDGDMLFSWFYPCKEGLMSADIIGEIAKLTDLGWKIYFI